MKLGDFGLSKALSQASFANTYVGVLVTSILTSIFFTDIPSADSLLYVTRTHAGESL